MRTISLSAVFILSVALLANAAAAAANANQFVGSQSFSPTSSKSIRFIENKGQWVDSILFRAEAKGSTVWLTNSSRYYQFFKKQPSVTNSDDNHVSHLLKRQRTRPEPVKTWMVRASFVRTNQYVEVSKEDRTEYRCNFFLGNDHSRWQRNVPAYETVLFHDLYPGIDLKYYSNGGLIEYDLIAAPGADLSEVEIRYDGADSIRINGKGELLIFSRGMEIIESLPAAYQIDRASKRLIDMRYTFRSATIIGLEVVGNFSPKHKTIVDPVIRFSSVYGGSDHDWSYGNAVDSSGDIYIVSATLSDDFPTLNAMDSVADGSYSAVLMKIDGSTGILQYSTYLGGSSGDWSNSICIDKSNNVYVGGTTTSIDFPTVNPLQAQLAGRSDFFVAALNANGDSLLYSTYFGGTGIDEAADIDIDQDQRIALIGVTSSLDVPLQNPYQSTFAGGLDALLIVIDPIANLLLYGTYLGGPIWDYGQLVKFGPTGDIVGCGTAYRDIPLYNAFQEYHGGMDVWVAKIDGFSYDMIFNSYLGGTNMENAGGLALDEDGDIYITGSTRSPDFPLKNQFQSEAASEYSAFLSKISGNGDSLIYSTYYNSGNRTTAHDIALDDSNCAIIVGGSGRGLPMRWTLQDFAGHHDGFVARFNQAGDDLLFASYLGGSNWEAANAICISGDNTLMISGETKSADFPTTDESQGNSGGLDVFILTIEECCYLTGDINDDKSIDVLDLMALSDFLFFSDIELFCREESDINGNGEVDIGDFLSLLDYLFRSGPPPIPCAP